MRDEKETRQKLLECAEREFMEKGYTAASLRSICRQAGVTTGALYFFFKDKADLFAALVEEPVNGLYEIMMGHYREELEMDFTEVRDIQEDTGNVEMGVAVVRYIYAHYNAFQLVLTKSQGSGFENYFERFVDATQEHYRRLVDGIWGEWGCDVLDDYTIHWMAHMHMDSFMHLFTHEKSEEEACRHIAQIVRYLVSGFLGILRMHKKPEV